MLIYFLVLVAPLTIGLMHPSRPQRNYWGFWAYFVVLLVFCGFRFEVGPDWVAYGYIFEDYLDRDFGEALAIAEPGYFLLNKVSDWLGFGLAGVVFGGSLIFLFGCFSYARQTSNPWLAVSVVLPYLVFIVSLSGIRQAAAIGLGFYLFAHWYRSSLWAKVLVIALAVSFHNSAGVLLFFVIFGLKRSAWLRVLLAAGVAVFVAYGLKQTDSFDKYKAVYIEQNVLSGGAFFHVLLIAFPSVLYLLFRKRLARAGVTDVNVSLAALLTLAAMPLLTVSSTGVDRLTLYFSFVQMWVYPALLRAKVANLNLLRLAVAVLVLAIFFVYFLFGSHAFAYLPYRNVLFN